MEEEMIDVELNLGKELADKLFKKTKKELLNDVVVLVLKTQVQTETIREMEDEAEAIEKRLNNKISVLDTKLDKAEAYVEQGRAMIESVMNRWHEYDA
jgi:hypothetical protein